MQAGRPVNITHTAYLSVMRRISGTVLLLEYELLRSALQRWGEHIVVGVDAHNGLIAIRDPAGANRPAHREVICHWRRFISPDIARHEAIQRSAVVTLSTDRCATTQTET